MNTQDPISWSDEITNWGMQLAYCPTDARRFCHYIPELIEIDDLFYMAKANLARIFNSQGKNDEAAQLFLHEDGFETGVLYHQQREAWPPARAEAGGGDIAAGLRL